MAVVQSINLLRTQKIIEKVNETSELIINKVEIAIGGDVTYYHSESKKIDLKISDNISQLRSSKPIRGTKAALNRLLDTVEEMDIEFKKLSERLLQGQGDLDVETVEKMEALDLEFGIVIKTFLIKTARGLKKEFENDKAS